MDKAPSAILNSPAFSDCTGAELEEFLVPAIKEIHFKRNIPINVLGCESPGLYLIASGKVRLFSTSGNKQLILEIAGPGEILGMEPIITGMPAHYNAVTMERTTVYLLPRHAFIKLMEHNPAFFQHVLVDMCHKLADARSRLVELAYQPVRQRVVHALLYLKRKYPSDHDGSFRASRVEVSMIAAVRRETATRVIRELEREGSLVLDGDVIFIRDKDALDMQCRE